MRHEFSTLFDLYDYASVKYAKRIAAEFTDGEQSYTYSRFKESCENLSRILSNFGIGAFDKVAILSENMPHWSIAFFSITAYGRIVVPMLNELSSSEVDNILEHSDAKAIFVSKRQIKKLSDQAIERLSLVIDIEDFSFIKHADDAFTCDGRVATPNPMDMAALIYTSGTTGMPKGVMLSHRNFCASVLDSWYAQPENKRSVFLSILPMAHTYEMTLGLLYPFSVGARVCYLRRVPTPTILIQTLREVRPTTILSVPLIIEKMYKSSILPTIRGSKFLSYLQDHMPRLLCALVGFKLRKTFGGRLHFFGIGGAKLDPEVETFLHQASFPYGIGYGLTETAPLVCAASPFKTHIGSTGPATHGVQIRLDNINPETGLGEITVKGPNVMMGYYKDYERTQAVLSQDGWFHTGDLASVDAKGRYSVRGRLRNMIVGASGENIYPEEIEHVINSMDGIGESLVIQRDGRLIALVKFEDNVLDWNLEGQDKFIEDLEKRRQAVLEFVNQKVSKFSNIKDVEIQKEPFSKTATHKIRRFLYEKTT
ncbi:MAG: AMP-binding protein [Bacteroidales bacterium]|nr:AMP-binding protein [Bacteroidales bacterium]